MTTVCETGDVITATAGADIIADMEYTRDTLSRVVFDRAMAGDITAGALSTCQLYVMQTRHGARAVPLVEGWKLPRDEGCDNTPYVFIVRRDEQYGVCHFTRPHGENRSRLNIEWVYEHCARDGVLRDNTRWFGSFSDAANEVFRIFASSPGHVRNGARSIQMFGRTIPYTHGDFYRNEMFEFMRAVEKYEPIYSLAFYKFRMYAILESGLTVALDMPIYRHGRDDFKVMLWNTSREVGRNISRPQHALRFPNDTNEMDGKVSHAVNLLWHNDQF